MTDQDIITYCKALGNTNATQADADAMRYLMVRFDCEDATTPQEAHEKIMASMGSIIEDLLSAPDETTRDEILRRRVFHHE